MILTFSRVPLQTPELDVIATVREVGKRLYADNLVASITWAKGRRVRFTINTLDAYAKGSRTSASGRHMRHASWEAHRDVMRALFKIDSDARIQAALATYRGVADFERKFEATGHKNVGSQMQPCTIRECSI